MIEEAPFFTVLLLTYNSDWVKIKQTLLSIIEQENVSFEIVISDDGSKENNSDKIIHFFEENNFTKFKIVQNQNNQGTVQNILSGLKVVSGEFVKPISPGDFFYSKDSLKKAYDYILKDNKQASAYFGRTAYYSLNDNKPIIQTGLSHPHDIRPYQKQNYRKIKRNYFIRHDTILGASVIYHTEAFKNHLLNLSDFVKFAEDYSLISILASNQKIKLITNETNTEDFFIWYESATGISTQKQSKWHEILYSELEKTFRYLYENKLISHSIYDSNFSPSKIKRFSIHITKDTFFYIKNKLIKTKSIGFDNLNPDSSFLTHLLEVK